MSFRYRVKQTKANEVEGNADLVEKVCICKGALLNIFQIGRKRIDLINAQRKKEISQQWQIREKNMQAGQTKSEMP